MLVCDTEGCAKKLDHQGGVVTLNSGHASVTLHFCKECREKVEKIFAEVTGAHDESETDSIGSMGSDNPDRGNSSGPAYPPKGNGPRAKPDSNIRAFPTTTTT